MWGVNNSDIISSDQKAKLRDAIIPALNEEASKLPVTEDDMVALDWLNGRRTPDANQELKASIKGLSLGSTAPVIFKALVEATAFGSKSIVNRFLENNIQIKSVVALGGVAKKSDFVMQTLSNVLDMPIRVVKSEQACALGAGMFAATAAGIYPTLSEAQNAMGSGYEKEYFPDPDKVNIYNELYHKYLLLGKFTEEGFRKMGHV
jgi:L-ribulokinase